MVRIRNDPRRLEARGLLRCESFLSLGACTRRLENLDSRRWLPFTRQMRVETITVGRNVERFVVYATWPPVVVMTGYLERTGPFKTRITGEVHFRVRLFWGVIVGVIGLALLAHGIHLPDLLVIPVLALWTYRSWLDIKVARDMLLRVIRNAVTY
jgi:hypothetical protein